MKIFKLSITLAMVLGAWGTASAQSFRMSPMVISSGGGPSSSTSFNMTPTLGQTLAGFSRSSGHSASFGFWYQVDALRHYHIFTYHFFNNWNLVSLADTVSDYRKTALFPFAISEAFSFENNGYTIRDTLKNRMGYWLKSPHDTVYSLVGAPISQDTFDVVRGWNLIGSIGTSTLKDSIVEIPPGIVTSQYFGYLETYVPETTIEPGRGYWVKTDTAGRLVLRPSSGSPVTLAKANSNPETQGMNVLSVQRATVVDKGNAPKQELIFGQGEPESPGRYDLPPIPPAGALDARFASNRFAEFLPDKIDRPKEIPILIQGNGGPLELTWTMHGPALVKYTLLEKQEGKISARHRLSSDGAITITPGENSSYILRVEQVPVAYALYQNYPNPFNPTTTVRFDLPSAANVSLRVYNVLGQEVMIPLNNAAFEEGQQSVTVDAWNLASGAYFYRLQAGGFVQTKKMLLLR